MKNSQKGFTLIELLVVIAIIGILASIVVAALSAARAKAADSSVKANLRNVASEAEFYYQDVGGGSYGTSLTLTGTACYTTGTGMYSDEKIRAMMSEATLKADVTSTTTCTTDASGQSWAVSVSLLKSAGTSWCVASGGAPQPNTTAAAGVCS